MTRLSLTTENYSDAQVASALVASGRTVRYRHEHLDANNVSLGYLDGVVRSAKLSYNYESAIKRTASFSVNAALLPSYFDPLSDRIRPTMGVKMPDGGWADFPLGLFVLVSPGRKYSGGSITRDMQGFDLAQVLTDDIVPARYVAKTAALYTDVLADLLSNVDSQITPSTLALPVDRTWDMATPKLTIVNDVLKALNYGSLYFDVYGSAICAPYIAPSDDISGWTYSDDSGSVMGTEFESTIDINSVPNTFVRYIGSPDRPLLTSTFQNTNPYSPTSVASRGEALYDIASSDAADQASLDAEVRKAAFEASQVYESISFSTVNMPFHGERDIVTVVHSGLGISSDYAERAWEMDLTVGGQMTHTLKRTTPIDPVS